MTVSFVTVIACGGEARRFGNAKANRLLAGVSLLDRAIGFAGRIGAPVALSVRETGDLKAPGIPRLIDDRQGIGPMSALISGAQFAAEQNSSHVLMIGCDQPFLPLDLAQRLAGEIGHNGSAVPVSRGFGQYMAALWRADLAAAEDYVAEGGRSLWRFADRLGRRDVVWETDPDQGDPFADIDDPAALAEAERRLQR